MELKKFGFAKLAISKISKELPWISKTKMTGSCVQFRYFDRILVLPILGGKFENG